MPLMLNREQRGQRGILALSLIPQWRVRCSRRPGPLHRLIE